MAWDSEVASACAAAGEGTASIGDPDALTRGTDDFVGADLALR